MQTNVQTNDPRIILEQSPMGRFQIVAVIICILLNALDGFDVLAISFASPGIAEEWGISRLALGVVLSMELFGMGIGSFILGSIADSIGRRPMIIGCLCLMTTGMLFSSMAHNVEWLSAYRFATGVGIGGMLASLNAMVAEYSNLRNRNLSVILMSTGYPIGVIIGGSIAAILLASYDWRSVFIFGSIATFSMIPIVWYLLPESIEFLSQKRPENALERINKTLIRMGHDAIDGLPEVKTKSVMGIKKLFSGELIMVTLILTMAYFTHIITFYFILKWIPKIVADMGFSASAAGSVLVWANVGGAIGCITLGLLTRRFGIRYPLLVVFLLATVFVSLFGQGQADLKQLSIVAAMAVFFANAGVVGLYALFAKYFPTDVRASGTGFAIGIGRGGAVLGPIIAGFLFTKGISLEYVAMIMACGSFLAACLLLGLKENKITTS